MDNSPKKITVRPKSLIPGRQRWEVDVVLNNPRVARLIEKSLASEAGIQSVRANPVTGRVLVFHEDELSTQTVASLVKSTVEISVSIAYTPSTDSKDELKDILPGGDELLLVAGSAAAGIGLLFVKSSLVLPLIVGAGALVATVAAVRHWIGRSTQKEENLLVAYDPASRTRKHPALILLDYLGSQRRVLYLATGFSILARILDMVPPLLIGLAVTVLINHGSPLLTGLGFGSVMSQIGFITVFGAVVWMLQAGLEFLASALWRNLAQTVEHRLRIQTYAHLQRIRIEYIQEERTGELVSILNDDINRLQVFLDNGANQLLVIITNVVLICPLFYFLAPTVAWIAILPIPIIAWLTFFYQENSAAGYSIVRDKAGVLNSQLINNLEGITTIKSFNTEDFEVGRIRQLSEDYRVSNIKPNVLAAAYTPMIRTAALISFAGIILFGAHEVIVGEISAGVFASLNSFTQRILWPFTEFGEVVDKYQRAMAAFERILNLQDVPVAQDEGGMALHTSQVAGEIRLESITFAYMDRAPVLNDLSLLIPAGKTTAIVGVTGIGKTTLVKLLIRFHEIDSGRILLDGVDIRELRMQDLREAIGLVSQDTFLFDGTVQENIAYGRFGVDQESVIASARFAEAHEFIEKLPYGYDTRIGERGLKLSGGQRQRLCLARTILKNPPILILDEATSFLDNRTEAAIQRALKRFFADSTTVIVTHRLTTIVDADVIYVLGEGGRVVEQGTHTELLEMNGTYSSLWRAQSGYDDEGSVG
jgi:ATP-binding cassette subfamily B protein